MIILALGRFDGSLDWVMFCVVASSLVCRRVFPAAFFFLFGLSKKGGKRRSFVSLCPRSCPSEEVRRPAPLDIAPVYHGITVFLRSRDHAPFESSSIYANTPVIGVK